MNLILSLLLIVVPYAGAQELPKTRWALNPQFKFQAKPNAPVLQSENGFQISFINQGIEVHSKGTRFTEEKIAKQMSKIEFANLERLYQARGNPYEGQVTEIIQCDKTYKPRSFIFKIENQEVKGLMAGANERRLFGACVKEQIAFWGGYFNFYDPKSKMVIENRVFMKTKAPNAATVNELSKKLESLLRALLVVRANP